MVGSVPGSRFKGEIAPAFADLGDSQTIRIIDLAFVAKDEDGDIAAFEIADLDPNVQEALAQMGAPESGLFSEEDLMAAGEEIEPGSSAALLVWEDLWAARLTEAIR